MSRFLQTFCFDNRQVLCFRTCLLMVLVLSSSVIRAQPDAGTLRQQIEEDILQVLPQEVTPPKPKEPEPIKPAKGLTVTVKAFRFSGNTLLTDEQLTQTVVSYLDRPLDITELHKAAAAVAKAYRDAGWIVRAYLPKQEIKDGIVTIHIIEAVFGQTVIEDHLVQRLSATTAQGFIESAQSRGDKLSAINLDRALLLLDDLPGIAATGSLRAGQQNGETDLLIKLADEPLTRMEVGADNSGARATGNERLLANLSFNSPAGWGDLINSNYVHSEGSDYLRAAYTLPVGFDGWRLGINGSLLRYDLIADEFKSLNGEGSSNSVGLEASYPIIRSRPRNLYLQLHYDHKTFDNKANGETTSHYQLDSASIGVVGNAFDKFGGGGANIASLSYVSGDLDLDGSPTQATDALTTRTAGQYGKWRYILSRQQVITNTMSLYATFSGQWSQDNLDSAEKFYLGGSSGIRAYPTSEAGGARGRMLNVELRNKLPNGFTLTPFFDWGQVTVNAQNNYTGSANPNNITLKGFGLALAWQGDTGLSAKFTLARRIGSNPNPISTGKDQDGSHIKNRMWASIMLPF